MVGRDGSAVGRALPMRRHELSNESQYSPGPQAGRASGVRAGGHGSAAPGVLRQRMHDFTTESQYSPDPQAGRLSSAIDSGVRQRDFLESHCSPAGHAPGPAFGEGGLCAICACDPHANRPSELVSPMTMALTSLNALSPYGSHRTWRTRVSTSSSRGTTTAPSLLVFRL
jgi:hypothetical protein